MNHSFSKQRKGKVHLVSDQATLARFLGLILLVVHIYVHLQVAHRSRYEGDFIGLPFYAATCCEWDAVRATRSTTVSAEKDKIESYRTIRCTRRHDLPDRDTFESWRLTG